MNLLQLYFNHCHSLFEQQRELSLECCDYYIKLADQFTIRLKFSDHRLVGPVVRALSHLENEPVETADFTICIWDSASASDFAPPYPSFTEKAFWGVVRNGPIQAICSDIPTCLSIVDAETKIGLFWIDDINKFAWYEYTRPLLDIFGRFVGDHGLQIVHASCVGSERAGVLIAGGSGSGKSTTALSFLNSSTLKYVGDDLCLMGADGACLRGYSMYNSGKLEQFDFLPHLEQYISNPERSSSEKAVIYVNECLPEQIAKSVPITAILLSSVGDDQETAFSPVSTDIAARTLVQSTAQILREMRTQEFFALYRMCAMVPCFQLKCGSDLEALHASLINLLGDVPVMSTLRNSQCGGSRI